MEPDVHAALTKAIGELDRSTGMHHRFVVKMSKADGSDSIVTEVRIVALNWADAWGLIGDAMALFMEDEHGRFVKSIEAVK